MMMQINYQGKTNNKTSTNKTATEAYIDVQPVTNVLNKLSSTVEYMHNTIANFVLNFTDTQKDKKEIMEKAKKLEADRDEAKLRSPWIGYANTAYQLAIVVLSASILTVSMGMFYGSFAVAAIGIFLSAQGVFLFL